MWQISTHGSLNAREIFGIFQTARDTIITLTNDNRPTTINQPPLTPVGDRSIIDKLLKAFFL